MPAKKVAAKNTTVSTSKRARKPKKQTHIALVVDRSGSMTPIADAAFDAINEQINAIKSNVKLTGDTYVSYIQFDEHIETVFQGVHAKDLQPITRDQYSPRGSTAIFDALGRAVEVVRTGVTETDDTAYLVVLISDGSENASREFTKSSIQSLMKQLEDSKKWTFSYMLSNLTVSQMYDFQHWTGAAAGNVSTFTSTNAGTIQASAKLSNSISTYATLRSSGQTFTNTFYEQPTDLTGAVNTTSTK